MQSKELLVHGLHLSYNMVLPLLEDLKSAPLVTPTPGGGNHAHWTLGHLANSEGRFRTIMRGVPNPVESWQPLFGGGTLPDPDATGYPSYNELLAKLIALHQETMEWVQTLEEADLDQPSKSVPAGFEPMFGTWGKCLLMQAMHWMNHRGQLADCRRAAGRTKMMA